jgi:hypothetical protein
MAKEEAAAVVRREIASILTPELVEVQGRNDREFLATRVKLLLDAKEKHPSASFADIANLADLAACGCGCCCCCSALVLPGSEVTLPQK